jgi:5-methylcytosine-specific restriction endonuclease McrA
VDRPNRTDFTDYSEYKRAYDRWRSRNPERMAASRAYYVANREAVLEQKKAYFQENKAQIRDYQRGYAKERYHADPEFRAKSIKRARASTLANWDKVKQRNSERYHSSPDLQAKVKQRNIDYMAGNADKVAEQRAKFREENRALLAARQAQWRERNPELARELVREYHREHRDEISEQARQRRESDPEWAAYLDAYRKEYYKNNKHKFIAHNALREERIRQATPPWLTKEQRTEMELVYRDAAELTMITGVKHEVDHIQPIKGRKSCGLHVPWNLQVLTWRENNRKRNKEPFDG